MGKGCEGKTDREILVEVSTDQKWIINTLNNHLKHHWIITTLALGAAFTGLSSFVVGIILLIVKFKVGI